MPSSEPLSFFATCPRGLEQPLQAELIGIGAQAVEAVAGGVHFSGAWDVCYRANLWSRIATRILWRVGAGEYRREDDIYALARSLPWHEWFAVGRTIRVAVTAIRSPLKSLDFATLRIKDAVCDGFRAAVGARPDVSTAEPDVRIHAFLSATHATLYLDTSGEPLYKRGYKQARTEAPIKENLAAGILRLAGWQPGEPLLDPMCGSGTFLVEAAQIALDIAPGLERGFGFERLGHFDKQLWQEQAEQARRRALPRTEQPIYGTDLYGEQIKKAWTNLTAAALQDVVHLKQGNVLELAPPAAAGVLVANPPYGVRLRDEKTMMAAFYPRFGDTLKQRFGGWRCYLFSADSQLPKLIGLRSSRRLPLYNGALECRLYEYRITAPVKRREGG